MNDSIAPMSTPNAPAEADRLRVRVWDNPASKIRFMESVCHGKDWSTILYADPDSGEAGKKTLRDLSLALGSKGYVASVSSDGPHNLTRLYVHHLGDENGLIANIHALGFVHGTMQSMNHLSGSLSAMIRHGKDLYDYVTSDKARLFSSFYLIGDLAYAFADKGYGAPRQKLNEELARDAKQLIPHAGPRFAAKLKKQNLLADAQLAENKKPFHTIERMKGLSGWFAIAQSAIYLYYARDTGTVAVDGLQHDVEKALKNGQDPLDAANWRNTKHHTGLVGKLDRMVRDAPIEAGAHAQQTGQGLLAASGVMRIFNATTHLAGNPELMQHQVKSGANDIARGLTSICAWHLLKQNPADPADRAAWYNPKRWVQEIEAHPQKASAIVNTGASVIGLMGAGHNGNWLQRSAEINYLIGDATMSMMKKSHYGGAESAVDLGAEAAAKLIADSNIVFAWEEEGAFVKRLSGYLAQRIAEETTIEGKFPNHKAYLEGVEKRAAELTPQLGASITEKLANRGRRLGSICHAAAVIVHQFPKEQRKAVIESLAGALSNTKAVYASPRELTLVITGQTEKLNTIQPNQSGKPTLGDLSGRVSELLVALPGYDLGSSAARLYESLQSHCIEQKRADRAAASTITQGFKVANENAPEAANGNTVPGKRVSASEGLGSVGIAPQHSPLNL